jgi:hypothetical protein
VIPPYNGAPSSIAIAQVRSRISTPHSHSYEIAFSCAQWMKP